MYVKKLKSLKDGELSDKADEYVKFPSDESSQPDKTQKVTPLKTGYQ